MVLLGFIWISVLFMNHYIYIYMYLIYIYTMQSVCALYCFIWFSFLIFFAFFLLILARLRQELTKKFGSCLRWRSTLPNHSSNSI